MPQNQSLIFIFFNLQQISVTQFFTVSLTDEEKIYDLRISLNFSIIPSRINNHSFSDLEDSNTLELFSWFLRSDHFEAVFLVFFLTLTYKFSTKSWLHMNTK